MAGGVKIRTILFRLIGIAVSFVLLALFAFSLIIAKPQEEDPAAAAGADLPSPEAVPALSVGREQDLPDLISAFPAPVMSFMSGSGMVFVSATSADAAFGGGFARIATLYWQTAEGEPVTLRSIWPADALSLLEDGYHFMPYTGPALFGGTSVRMENDDSVRIHIATDRALYAVLLPRSLSQQAGTLCRSLQLFTAGSEN